MNSSLKAKKNSRNLKLSPPAKNFSLVPNTTFYAPPIQRKKVQIIFYIELGVPQELIASLAVDPNVLEAEEQAVIEAEVKEEEQNVQNQLRHFFSNYPDVEARCNCWIIILYSRGHCH